MSKSQEVRILAPTERGVEKPRNYYLWVYQPHFQIAAKIAAEGVFKQLDDRFRPELLVVAINTASDDKRPAAVVEPEDADLSSPDFENAITLALENEKAIPGPSYAWQEDDGRGEAWAERMQRRDFRSHVRRAVHEIARGASAYDHPRVYVSDGRELGSYIVFCVLRLDPNLCDEYPRLHRTSRDIFTVVPSFIDAVANEFLRACWEAILGSFDGDGYADLSPADAVLRAAARSFMYPPFGACDQFEGLHGGFDTCNEISTLTYERSVGNGRLLLAKRGHENICETISLKTPVPLRNYRAVRKLLELAGAEEALVCDSLNVITIGRLCGTYDHSKEDLFAIDFFGHAKWQLTHAGVPLMRVEHGIPQLSQKRQQVDRFIETYCRLFPDAGDRQRKAIRAIANDAAELTHGTVIIIREDAAAESERFGNQALRIEPSPLTYELMQNASRIDGAVLVSPDGVCHALGVILDGPVSEKGTSVRGARYNSTIRYVDGSFEACLGLIISDDGMIDMFPKYRPLMSRRVIEEKIAELSKIANEETVSQRKLNSVTEWLSEHRFYLLPAQCDRINRLIDSTDARCDESAGNVIYGKFDPDPEMEDSFLKD